MIAATAIRRWLRLAVLGTLCIAAARSADAEVSEVRVAQQYGISYLPLTIMAHEKLLEAAGQKAGLGTIQTSWKHFGAGNAMNEALLSGNLDFASGGVGPLIVIWSK
ncbi:MAG: ABC transporter substrate-binding protein, partial [Alphaproteobacteria bacterium]|nr:ABC transporter substrate-binding protein [Alphaproteobacteria bacterium]